MQRIIETRNIRSKSPFPPTDCMDGLNKQIKLDSLSLLNSLWCDFHWFLEKYLTNSQDPWSIKMITVSTWTSLTFTSLVDFPSHYRKPNLGDRPHNPISSKTLRNKTFNPRCICSHKGSLHKTGCGMKKFDVKCSFI